MKQRFSALARVRASAVALALPLGGQEEVAGQPEQVLPAEHPEVLATDRIGRGSGRVEDGLLAQGERGLQAIDFTDQNVDMFQQDPRVSELPARSAQMPDAGWFADTH